jgi:hypothetical protein
MQLNKWVDAGYERPASPARASAAAMRAMGIATATMADRNDIARIGWRQRGPTADYTPR